MIPRSPEPERGFVLAVLAQGADADDELAEVEELARTAGVEPVGRVVQHRGRPAQRTYVGKGKLEELRAAVRRRRGREPARRRRARSGAAALPRGRARGARHRPHPADPRHLRPARGHRRGQAAGRARPARVQPAAHAGHVAAPRAPRRRRRHARPGRVAARDRPPARAAARLGAEAAAPGLERQRATRRKERRRTEVPTIALAGYTNVGKSTLLNALTGAEVSVENRLFETLDPTTRGFEHDGRRYLVTDTVGFIRRLPHQLVEGFAATLEETLVADLVLHVADASARDDQLDAMVARGRGRARRDRRGRAAGSARPEQDRPGRRDRPAAAREPLPGRAAGLGRDRGGARRAEGADRRAVRRPASSRCGCCSRTTRADACRSCTRSARRSSSARTRRTACSSSRACRGASSGASRRSWSPTRRSGRPPDRAADPAAARRGGAARPRAYAGDAGLDLVGVRARRARPGRARARADRARRGDPRGVRRLRPAALGPRRASTASRS